MNILFITTKCPLPANDGHSLRSFNLLKQVATVHKVHLLSFVKYQHEYEAIGELEKICCSVKLFEVPENNSKTNLFKTLILSLLTRHPFVALKYDTLPMRMTIRRKLANTSIDLVHFDMLPLAVYLNEIHKETTILNEHNIESLLLKRRVGAETRKINRWFFRRQQKMLERFERTACRGVNYIISCSEKDRNVLKTFAPDTPAETIPNGVDTNYFTPDKSIDEEHGNMVFVGGLNWFPNQDGLQWFDKNVFPNILHKYPEAHLHIIGQQGNSIEWRHKKAITCHGFVEDIRPYMTRASVFIVPLRIGGGTRLKILNAMSMEKAVVSTSIGAEGLGLVPGENADIVDLSRDFATAITALFEDYERRREIAHNARNFVKEHYRWNNIGQRLIAIYDHAMLI